jgi:hypothetical protein
VLTLGLLALLVFASVCARLGDRVRPDAGDTPERAPSPAQKAWRAARSRRQPTARLLPEGHRPPAGLGPLSPSERFLRTESARGITALQLWLIDQAA